jgi:hypothetical protein
MTTARFSTVLDQPVETVWSLIRDFNNYPAYIEGVTESHIEDDRPGDEVGAVRRFLYGDTWLRQRLTAHSDTERSLTYAGMSPFVCPEGLLADPPSPANYEGTMSLQRIIDGDRTFIDWSVTLEASPEEADAWRGLLGAMIPDWTASLRRTLDRRAA